jgi:hypothetical protein
LLHYLQKKFKSAREFDSCAFLHLDITILSAYIATVVMAQNTVSMSDLQCTSFGSSFAKFTELPSVVVSVHFSSITSIENVAVLELYYLSVYFNNNN